MSDTDSVLVTSIQDSTGKTAITLALGLLARERGRSVGYMKPKGTRLQSSVGKTLDEDPMLARELLDLEADIGDMEPVVYSPMFVEQAIRGKEDPAALRERVQEAYAGLAADRDLMVVEGGGSHTTGGIVDLTDADVAELLDCEAVLVTRYGKPRDVDDVLAAARRLGDRLSGIVFNAVTDESYDGLENDVVPFLESKEMPVHGVIPHDRELAGVTVAQLAEELAADQINAAPDDTYIERFMVGAMGADEALRYFRRTKDTAVITGGDRSEIQTVALEASGVRCLILTGGHRPPGAVVGKAEQKGVPILLVNTDTLTTVDRAEDVVHSGRTRDEMTVDRMRDLVADHVDVDAIVGEDSRKDE